MAVLPFARRARPSPDEPVKTHHREQTRCEACGAPTVSCHPEAHARVGYVHLWCNSCDHDWWMPERRLTPDPRS